MSDRSQDFSGLDEGHNALLISLRQAVEPILANNFLPHLTDHSVRHSDSLIELLNSLLNPLARSLSQDEEI